MMEGIPVLQEITESSGLYLYLSLGTATVFVLFGAYLGRSEQRLAEMALVDSLTGLYNNRFFCERLHEEYSRAMRSRERLSLALIDLDYFKRVNDEYGHVMGDQLLRQVAQAMKDCSREWETIARVGGEEFCVILANCDRQEALAAAERFREVISNVAVNDSTGAEMTVTASVGVATSDTVEGNEWDLYSAADKAMYQAKDAGRDRSCTYE
jgi:diguanylate cyclase (GGDEF)-like protein